MRISTARLVHRIAVAILLLSTCFVAGCGSSNRDFFSGPDSSDPGFAPHSIAGRVLPGVPAIGVTVLVTSDDGEVLAETVTDESGSFLFPGLVVPQRYHTSAILDGGLELEGDTEGTSEGDFVILNIPTTLAARLARAHGMAPDVAKEQVANFLGLSNGIDLEYGLSEFDASSFSHLKFFIQAAQFGGSEALLNQLLEDLESGIALREFHASLDDLDVPLQIPDSLREEFRMLQLNPTFRQAILSSGLRQLPELSELMFDGVTSAQPKTLNQEPVRFKIVGTLISVGAGVAWTHIADAANLNYGTSTMLKNIQRQLSEVLNLLSGVSIALDEHALDQAVNTLYNDAIVGIDTYNARLVRLNLDSILSSPELPYTPSNDTLELLSSVQGLNTQQSLRIIRTYLDPIGQGTKLLVDGQSHILSNYYGQGMTADSGNFPFRSQNILDQVFHIFEYYSNYQQLAINLLGETAHLQSNPTDALLVAQDDAEDTIRSLYRQRAVLPPGNKLPNNVVVDLQAGLMWYTTIIAAKSTSDANAYAESFRLSNGHGGTYDDWHLPTGEEYRILRERARLVNPSLRDAGVEHDGSDPSPGNYGYSTQGLTALGFSNANILNSDGSVLYADYGYVLDWNNVPVEYKLLGTGWGSTNNQFRFNHENSDLRSTTNKRPFFLVRSIGKPVVSVVLSTNVDSIGLDFPYKWSEVKDFEYEMFGRVVGIQDTTLLTPEGSTDQLPDRVGADLIYEFAVGGSFPTGGSSYRMTFPRRVYNSEKQGLHFPTYNGPADAYSESNNRNRFVSFRLDNPAEVSVTPTGRIRWWANGTGAIDLHTVASTYTMSGVAREFEKILRSPVSTQRKLTQIQMFPRNRQYFLTSVNADSEQYHCLAFYSDDTVEDVTAQAQWEAVDADTGVSVPSAYFSVQSNGFFTLNNDNHDLPEFIELSVSIGSAEQENDKTVVQAVTR